MVKEVLGAVEEAEKQVAFLNQELGRDAAPVQAEHHDLPDEREEREITASLARKNQKPLCLSRESARCALQRVRPLTCQSLQDLGHHPNRLLRSQPTKTPTLTTCKGI